MKIQKLLQSKPIQLLIAFLLYTNIGYIISGSIVRLLNRNSKNLGLGAILIAYAVIVVSIAFGIIGTILFWRQQKNDKKQ